MAQNRNRLTIIPINRYSELRPTTNEDTRVDTIEYQQRISNVLYIIIYIRLDIIFAISKLSQYISNLAQYYYIGIIHL
jgi:hypothetical protein